MTAPVVGNDMTLGLTNGTVNAGLSGTLANVDISFLGTDGTFLGTNVGTPRVQQWQNNGTAYSLGVTTNPAKSGLVARLSDITLGTVDSIKLGCYIIKF